MELELGMADQKVSRFRNEWGADSGQEKETRANASCSSTDPVFPTITHDWLYGEVSHLKGSDILENAIGIPKSLLGDLRTGFELRLRRVRTVCVDRREGGTADGECPGGSRSDTAISETGNSARKRAANKRSELWDGFPAQRKVFRSQ